MKQLFITSILTSIVIMGSTALAQNGVYCQLKDVSACTDCQQRIPASCENHKFTGSIDAKVKPSKVHWLISNTKTGSDRVLVTENFGLDVQGLRSQKDLRAFLKKQKVTVTTTEKISLVGVNVANETALYKNQTGTAIAATMTANPARGIASDAPTAQIGGIRRALKLQTKGSK